MVEHTGLSVQEARTAIEDYERAAVKERTPQSVNELTARLLASQSRGSLAQRVRDVVEDNRSRVI